VEILLIPLGVLVFILFLLVLGAIGLGAAMAVLGAFGWLWRLVNRGESRRRS
jgi:Flp pilus assembly protein TadB